MVILFFRPEIEKFFLPEEMVGNFWACQFLLPKNFPGHLCDAKHPDHPAGLGPRQRCFCQSLYFQARAGKNDPGFPPRSLYFAGNLIVKAWYDSC